MNKQDKLKKLQEQLDALKIFPKSKLVLQLKKQVTDKIKKLKLVKPPKRQINKQQLANQSRSAKLKKYHRYIKLIRNNFPNLDHSTIRKQFSKRRQGKQVSIPDAIWQNPSP